MPNDIREQILERLKIVCQVDGVKGVGRNVQDLADLVRPAVIIHDGNEQIDQQAGRPDPRGRVQLQELMPIFCIYFNSSTKNIGSVANQFRMAIVAAIFNDTDLAALLFNKQIYYKGCTLVPPEMTETREARFEIEVSFTYPFRVSDFTS
jgi:hypothetical protein